MLELERPDTSQHADVWGADDVALHDRFWANKRVQIVRRAVTDVDRHGPALYLLVDRDDLVLFNLAPVVKHLNWIKPRAMRLRISDQKADAYVERVMTDPAERLIGIRRFYGAATNATRRVTLTASASLAELWAASEDPVSGWRQIRSRCGSEAVFPHAVRGRLFDAGDSEAREAFHAEIVGRWRDLAAAFDGVYEFKPGVFLHETVNVDETSKLVGPLWIGAGVDVGAGRVLVGPRIIGDQPGSDPERRAIVWDQMRPPGWRLMPRVRRPRRRLRLITKRLFDIGFSAGVLLCTLPLYPVVMLLIWREDGRPFFFAHTRQTIHGRDFPCYKFRTMRRDAEQLKAELQAKNQADGPQFFIDDDPRLLRIGKTLRRFQIDELPQFFNVLRGQMSVVGPRPSPDKENQFCPAWREARLSVRPGVTGLWQVRRTREPQTDFQEWIRYDLEYVQHESWRLDIWIVMQTIRKVIGD